MRFSRRFRALTVLTLSMGMVLLTGPAMGDDLVSAESIVMAQVTDVELAPGGILHGQLQGANGQPQARQVVLLRGADRPIVQALSNDQGQFAMENVQGGAYELIDGDHVMHVRCWSAGTAPPHAVSAVLVHEGQIVRGQVSPSCWSLTNPWVIAGLVAAAIAIPVALHNNRDDRESASE